MKRNEPNRYESIARYSAAEMSKRIRSDIWDNMEKLSSDSVK